MQKHVKRRTSRFAHCGVFLKSCSSKQMSVLTFVINLNIYSQLETIYTMETLIIIDFNHDCWLGNLVYFLKLDDATTDEKRQIKLQ